VMARVFQVKQPLFAVGHVPAGGGVGGLRERGRGREGGRAAA
jgi:hypothetical protein